jgi:Cytochrome c554 and c-prime
MKRYGFLLLLLAVPLMLAVASAQDAATVTLITSGAAHGKLKPCACSEESDIGGMLRRDTAVAKLRADYPDSLLLDAGGSFKEPTSQGKLSAAAYLNGLVALGYDAGAIGRDDLLFGESFLTENGAGKLFVSNAKLKKKEGASLIGVRQWQRGGTTVRAFAVVFEADLLDGDKTQIQVEPVADYLRREARDGDLNIVLCSTDPKNARALPSDLPIDVIVNASPEGDVLNDPAYEFDGDRVYVETGFFGSRLGVLELKKSGGKIASAVHRFVSLDKTYADGPRFGVIHEAFEKETKRRFLAALAGKPAFDAAASSYVGAQACRPCHAQESVWGVWKKSRHGRAWASLQRVNKTFDPSCVGCHVVAYGEPGGFHSEEASPHLADVGCEVCHGPGRAHVESLGKVKIPKGSKDRCKACHDKEHAPAFVLDEALPKIKHQGKAHPPLDQPEAVE